MRANSGGIRALGWVASLCVVLQTPACAQDLVFDQGRWVHRTQGVSIADPGRVTGVDSGPGGDGVWQRVDTDGAWLTFRGPGGATMSMIRHCGGGRGDARVLARLLLIGLEDRRVLDEGPVSVAGGPGWRQEVTATDQGRPIRLASVTRVLGECSIDWVVVTSGDLEPVEADFDAWWASFRLDSPERAESLGPPSASQAPVASEAGR